MARQSNCEHDIGFYRVVGGDGLDVVEKCSECGEIITNESPKTVIQREEQEKEERKKVRRKKQAAEKKVEKKNSRWDY